MFANNVYMGTEIVVVEAGTKISDDRGREETVTDTSFIFKSNKIYCTADSEKRLLDKIKSNG